MTVEGTLIEGNTASGAMSNNGGGGLFNNGGMLSVNGATIRNNKADGAAGSGGGILNDVGGMLVVASSTLSANSAVRAGGGIEDNAGASVALTDVDLLGNSNRPQSRQRRWSAHHGCGHCHRHRR
jgi:hypothetical protein